MCYHEEAQTRGMIKKKKNEKRKFSFPVCCPLFISILLFRLDDNSTSFLFQLCLSSEENHISCYFLLLNRNMSIKKVWRL